MFCNFLQRQQSRVSTYLASAYIVHTSNIDNVMNIVSHACMVAACLQECMPLYTLSSTIYKPKGNTYIWKHTHTTYSNAFFAEEEASERKKWMRALTRSLGDYSLKCTATDRQVTGYLMKKLEEFYARTLTEEGAQATKHAVDATGLQLQPARKLWVLNQHVQIDEDGKLVDPDESPMVWLGQYFRENVRGTYSRPYVISENLASTAKPELDSVVISNLLYALQACYAHNFPACLLILGAEILCLHYEAIMNIAEQVPAAMVYGNVCHGKSRACRAALSLLGVHYANYISKISDIRASRRSSTTTLGILIDDPSDAADISQKILVHFEQGTTESCQAIHKPRTTFITTVNHDCLKWITEEQR